MNEFAEGGVFLRRPADNGEGPDRALAVIDGIDVQHGKFVRQAVISQVVAERAFGQGLAWIDGARNAKVGFGGYGEAVFLYISEAAAGQPSRKSDFGQAFGKGHNRGERMGGRPADKNTDPKGLALCDGICMVDADVPPDLVMQTDLSVGFVLVARELDAVHPQVGFEDTGIHGIFGVDLGEQDEGAAVVRPALDLREPADRGCIFKDGTRPNPSGRYIQGDAGDARGFPGRFHIGGRVGFDFDKTSDPLERGAEDEAGTFQGAEKVRHGRKGAAFDVLIKEGRPVGLVHAAVNFGHFKVGIDFIPDPDEVAVFFQVPDAVEHASVTHHFPD